MKHYLCIDYGREHVGLAIATTPLAEPIETVKTDQALQRILDVVRKHQIHHLVFGLSEGQMAAETQKFALKVASESNLPIDFQDETLSSAETRRKLAQAGASKKRREAKIDHIVAASILQEYLDAKA